MYFESFGCALLFMSIYFLSCDIPLEGISSHVMYHVSMYFLSCDIPCEYVFPLM